MTNAYNRKYVEEYILVYRAEGISLCSFHYIYYIIIIIHLFISSSADYGRYSTFDQLSDLNQILLQKVVLVLPNVTFCATG